MPQPGAVVTRFCPAGRWTQIEWYVGTLWLTKLYDAGGVHVDWRFFAAGIPPYWGGSFTGAAEISLPPSAYTSLELKPATDVTVRITTR